MKRLTFTLLVAAVLWGLMFFPLTAPHFDFWQMMAGSALLLTGLATLFAKAWWRRLHFTREDILLGVAIAVVLWMVFWVGEKIATWLFDFARGQVDSIYTIKDGNSPALLSLLLVLLIGPAEEIYWRGYVQEQLTRKLGADRGFLIATAAYTLVHVASLNFMLVMSALVCGVVWGGLYRLFPDRFTAIVISHALWDAAVFVWFPIL